MVKRRVLLSLVSVLVLFLAVVPTFAYPVTPYFASGSTQPISADVTLDLPVGDADPAVSISVGALETHAGGSNGDTHATAGTGNGLDVDLVSGVLEGVEADLINVESAHALGDPEVPDTDSDALIDQNTLLVDVGALNVSTSSFAQATDSATMQLSHIEGLMIRGDALGLTDLLSTDAMTGTIDNHTEGLGAESVAQNRIDNFLLELPLGLGDVVSADFITTTARTFSDGTDAGAVASVVHEFDTLLIQGVDYSDALPNTVIPLLGIGGGEIGSVTIAPIADTTITPALSEAHGVALRITVDMVGILQMDTDVGTTGTVASVEPRPPTAVTYGNVKIAAGQNLSAALLMLSTLGLLVTGTLLSRRR